MSLYTKESLERLKTRIDIQAVIARHLDLKASGVVYKGLCPFHEEKSPSFTVQRGKNFYHCFGCGAHGDAIQFLMQHLKVSFVEAIELLASQFQVHLEKTDDKEQKSVDKAPLRKALEEASSFYRTYLLESQEGKEALRYLEGRGINLNFIRKFEMGLSPSDGSLFRKQMQLRGVDEEALCLSGLLSQEKRAVFFRERITFPIYSNSGFIVGFSARKFKEETFGGKYINTQETTVFKKSRLLFGLHLSKERIVKEKKVMIVEGQIDALRLIDCGFDYAIASLGTAFTSDHVAELKKLGIREVILLFDGDDAGLTAASKVGNLFQKVGIEVTVVLLPPKSDPDSFLREFGADKLKEKLASRNDYLTFQIQFLSKKIHLDSPAGKNEIASLLKEQIQKWDEPVMVHEALRKVAMKLSLPEEMFTTGSFPMMMRSYRAIEMSRIDPDRILELDLLRWLVLVGDEKREIAALVFRNLIVDHFRVPVAKTIFESLHRAYLESKEFDLLSILIDAHDPEVESTISEILNKKINREKGLSLVKETIQKILERAWLSEKEKIARKMISATSEEVLMYAKELDSLNAKRPNLSLL